MSIDDLYDWSSFSGAGGSLSLLGNGVRKALSGDDSVDTVFRARALQGYHQLTPAEIRAYNLSNSSDGGKYYGFTARAIGESTVDVFLENPCDPAWSAKPEYTNKVIALHTMYLAANQEEAAQVTQGDIVLVEKADLSLKHGRFISLLSVEAPPDAAGQECFALKNLTFAGATAGSVGDKTLYTPDVPQPGLPRKETKCTKPSTGDFSALFGSVTSEEPGSQMGEFGKNNYRYSQPSLGNLKWFYEKGVRTFVRFNGDSGAKMKKCKNRDGTYRDCIAAGDLSYSYDPQTGLCIGRELETAYINSLTAGTSETVTIISNVAYDKHSPAVKQFLKAAAAGNTMVHCTHGADRTGFAVAMALQAYSKKELPPEKGKSSSAGSKTSLEDLYKYTVSFNSWDSHVVCGKNPCGNLGYVRYLDQFYPFAKFCAKKDRIKKCGGCKCRVAISKYGITGVPEQDQLGRAPSCKKYPGATYYAAKDGWADGCWKLNADGVNWDYLGPAK